LAGSSDERKGYIETLSRLFERIGGWSYDHRWIVLSICILLLGACALAAWGVRFDNSFEAYFDQSDPTYSAYLQFREDFGSDEISYILYEAPTLAHGPWDLEVMRKIQKLTEALEEDLPFVKEVTSLANVEFLEGIPDGIKIYDLLDEFPESQEALLEIKGRVLDKPMYVGGLASRDGQYAAIVIEMEKSSIDPLEEIKLDPEGGTRLDNLYPQATHHRIEEILARPEYEGIQFHHTGDVPLNTVYNIITMSESAVLGGICFALVGALLLFFFRRPMGVIGPLAVVTLSILISIALVNLVDWELDLFFGMLPTLLIAVGVADSVHILSEFRAYHAELGDRREAVRRTLYLVGTPCLLTSLTTATGFASMTIAPIKAISHFATYSAVGVLAAFLLSVTLLMVFLSFGRKTLGREATEQEKLQAKGGRFFKVVLEAVARFDIRHRRSILVFFSALFIFSGLGIARLRVDSNFLTDFSGEVPIRKITTFVDNTMGGTGSFVYLFDTGVPDGIKEPEVLREIERLQAEADRQSPLIMKTYSIVDVLKDINRSFHDGDRAYQVLPETRELVAQYLLLYEMSGGEELEEYVSSDYSRASLELRCKLVGTSRLVELVEHLDAYLQAEPLEASTASMTGMGALWVKLMDYITQSQIRGFLLAFTAIAAMMCFLLKSLKIGLVCMIPNLSPVVLTLGVMGWLGIPLDYNKLLIAAVAIGISVDDTIHHVTRYIHEFLESGDYEQALYASMRDVGRALLITSAVLVVGFLVLLFSVMDSQASFGVLLATTIAVALIADFFLMPALVMTLELFGPSAATRE
jgi:predicted RND superfamily exporter protein